MNQLTSPLAAARPPRSRSARPCCGGLGLTSARRPIRGLAGELARGSALALALALTAPLAAQIDPADDPPRHGLEAEVFRTDSLGLAMHVPLDAVIQVQRVEDHVTVQMIDGALTPAWSIRIQSLTSTLTEPSPAAQVDQLIESWRTAGRQFTIVANDEITCGELDGQLCYLAKEPTPGEPDVISGWLILPTGGRQFLVFSTQMIASELPRLRALFDTSFATIRVHDLGEIADERKGRLERAGAILASFTPERLRAVIGREQWFRYYIPASIDPDGKETELGYYAVEVSEDTIGALDPNRSAGWNRDTDDLGMLVRVSGHYIDSAANMVYDSEARYWLAWDRSEEGWSIRGTRRQGSKSVTEAVTGIRSPRGTGQPAGSITVIGSSRDGTTRDEKSWKVPDVYLSQATRWCLGDLLPRTGAEPIEFGAYCVDNTTEKASISLRFDRWEPSPRRPGHWLLTSQTRSGAPKTVTLYDEEGRLVRREWPDGRLTVPITLDALHRLWKSKGLETGRKR